jgi:hypothetical protein
MPLPEIRMKRIAALLVASALAWPLAAQAPRAIVPEDFAWAWPVQTDGNAGVVRFALTPEVYARITRADLADLAAFNAAGESIPLAPAALASERLAPPPAPAPQRVPLFNVPRAAPGAAPENIELHIARGPDGRLTQLDAAVSTLGADTGANDVLLDLGTVAAPVTALEVELEAAARDHLNARVDVEASDDLANWSPVASNLAVVSLRENGIALERRRLDFAATRAPYLRLRRRDADAPLPLTTVNAYALRPGVAPEVPLQSAALQGTPDAGLAGVFVYALPGLLPVQRLEVRLADTNAIATVIVESRDAAAEPWIERSRQVAFRLGEGDDAIESPPLDLAALRNLQWRVRTEPAQARAPALTVWYRPDTFVMLTQGAAPYRLAAGSFRARRPDYPMRTLLAEMQSRQGDLWLPPEARLGNGAPLSGEAALRAPAAPPPYKRWLLWGVLIAGALGVLWMVASLARGGAPGEGAQRE